MSAKRYDTRLVRSLIERGFDESFAVRFESGATVRCSQCEACSINSVPCHEQGCSNVVPTCGECGGLDPERTCCQYEGEGEGIEDFEVNA